MMWMIFLTTRVKQCLEFFVRGWCDLPEAQLSFRCLDIDTVQKQHMKVSTGVRSEIFQCQVAVLDIALQQALSYPKHWLRSRGKLFQVAGYAVSDTLQEDLQILTGGWCDLTKAQFPFVRLDVNTSVIDTQKFV